MSLPVSSIEKLLLTWQGLVRDENGDARPRPLVVAPAVQMVEPKVGDERRAVVEDGAALVVGAVQRPPLAGDAVARVLFERHGAAAVEAAGDHGVHDGEDVVGDEAAAERARLAARRARDGGLEAADAHVADDVAVEALLHRRQADAPANRAAEALVYPLPLRWSRGRVRVGCHRREEDGRLRRFDAAFCRPITRIKTTVNLTTRVTEVRTIQDFLESKNRFNEPFFKRCGGLNLVI